MSGRERPRWWVPGAVGVLLLSASAAALQATRPGSPPPEGQPAKSFAIFALSRGKGVPEAAREVLRLVTQLVEADEGRGVGVKMRRTRIGLEGETKLCVAYEAAADARRALEQVEKIAKDVDLVNLVPGPCEGKEKADEKEGKP